MRYCAKMFHAILDLGKKEAVQYFLNAFFRKNDAVQRFAS